MNPLDSSSLLSALGALAVQLVLFAETGLVVGFLLPGDSRLLAAAFCADEAASGVRLNLVATLGAAVVARWRECTSVT